MRVCAVDNPRYSYHRDHLGSTRTVLEVYNYMPFGEFMSGRITTSGTGTRPKFTGHTFNDETALYTMHWRRYNARIGQFRTPDPMADSYPGWNAYAYVLNDPNTLVDPTGMCAELGQLAAGTYEGDEAGRLYAQHCGTGEATEPPEEGIDYVDEAAGLVPFYGSARDLYQGLDSGDYWQMGFGAGFLALDFFTLGGGTYIRVVTKAGIRFFRVGAAAKTGQTIIGEGMKRVSTEAAKREGSVILNNMPNLTGTADQITSQMMTFNRQWLLQQMRSGRPILDIGLDPARGAPSIFYQMEQNRIKNYLKLHPNAFQIINP